MDPQATLELFLTACDDWQNARVNQDAIYAQSDALNALGDLSGWIARGGFLPRRGNISQPDAFTRGVEAGVEDERGRQYETDAGMDF